MCGEGNEAGQKRMKTGRAGEAAGSHAEREEKCWACGVPAQNKAKGWGCLSTSTAVLALGRQRPPPHKSKGSIQAPRDWNFQWRVIHFIQRSLQWYKLKISSFLYFRGKLSMQLFQLPVFLFLRFDQIFFFVSYSVKCGYCYRRLITAF